MCGLQVILVIWIKHNYQEKMKDTKILRPEVDFKITLNSQLKS